MASIINAATSGGLVTSADTSGVLQLQTASTTAVTVDASQNVGVGMTPVYKLDVTGGNGNAIRFTDSVNSVQVAMGAFNSQGFFGTLSNHPQLFYVNSGEGMRLTSTGLGIGTSSPSASFKLDVTGLIRSNATANGGGQFTIAKSGTTVGVLCGSGNVIGSAATDLALYAETGNAVSIFTNGSATARATFDTSGNLGVGTTSPSDYFSTASKFVIANTSGDVGMTIATSSTGTGNIFWADATSGTGEYSGYIQYAHNGDSMRFGTAATERARIDSSGNLGIGTSSPVNKLQVAGAVAATGGAGGYAENMALLDVSGGNAQITAIGANTSTIGTLVFQAFSSNASLGGERARIDSSGNLLVASTNSSMTTGTGIKLTAAGGGASTPTLGLVGNSSDNGQGSYHLYSSSLSQYQFYVTYGGTIYARSTSITGLSDVSEKENIRDLETGLNSVLALQPRRFDWKNGSGTNVSGFIAQEVQSVLPDLVESYKISDEENKLGLKMGDMIPTLVKAIQEQQAIIDSLKARLDAANL